MKDKTEYFYSLRNHFPVLQKRIDGNSIVYLDNAATSLKPQQVIDAVSLFYSQCGGTIYRGVYSIAEEATSLYENARGTVAHHLNAQHDEIVFTKGTTEGINAIASSFAEPLLKSGDQIIITALEHHSNIVPWQYCAQKTGALLSVVPVDPQGNLDMKAFDTFLNKKTKIVALCHVSNVLGICNDVKMITRAAHAVGAHVLLDAAQSAPHQSIDTKDLECDFLVFSGHKMLGPTGIGVLYCARRTHELLKPYQRGGGMITAIDTSQAQFLPMPHMLEAGTPPIAEAIGLACAIEYIETNIDMNLLAQHEASLSARLFDGLSTMKKIKIYGQGDHLQKHTHVVNFSIKDTHSHDVASMCNRSGVCVRAGYHCAQPLAQALGMGPTVRASVYVYNSYSDIDRLLESIAKVISLNGDLL